MLFGGLLFQPLSRNLLGAYQFQSDRINYYYDNFVNKELYKEHPELVVLSTILPDPLNTYFNEFREGIVDEINDKKIRTLKDAAAAFAETPEFYVIKFIGYARPLVLERSAVESAERIKRNAKRPGTEPHDQNFPPLRASLFPSVASPTCMETTRTAAVHPAGQCHQSPWDLVTME